MTTELRIAELADLAGKPVGTSRPFTITQDRIDGFASITEDEQWIHVDPERSAHGPFGTTIAHGFLTLSLLSAMLEDVVLVSDAAASLNYGLNRVRFPSPVPVGSVVRGEVGIESVTVSPTHAEVVWNVTMRVDGAEKPSCVALMVSRHLPE